MNSLVIKVLEGLSDYYRNSWDYRLTFLDLDDGKFYFEDKFSSKVCNYKYLVRSKSQATIDFVIGLIGPSPSEYKGKITSVNKVIEELSLDDPDQDVKKTKKICQKLEQFRCTLYNKKRVERLNWIDETKKNFKTSYIPK